MKWRVAALAVLSAGAAIGLDAYGVLRLNFPAATEFPVWGIDVSHHQGSIDWPAVSRMGTGFAYIKATEGGDWQDPRFRENWTAAQRAGIPRGAYHFFTLCTPGEEQARNFADTVPSDPDALRPVVDLEFGGNCSHRPNPTDLKTDLEAYLEATERHAGKRPILYVTYAFLRAYPVPPNADLWIRDVFSRPRISQGRWLVWQFHSRGRVDGISGPVDLNVFDGPRDAFPANLR